MQIIDKNEIMIWLDKRKLLDHRGELLHTEFTELSQYKFPVDSGKKTALSKTIASFFDTDSEALLWINEFGIWPSSEDINLFNGFRRSLGEFSALTVKPGHIFSSNDLETIGSLLSMILYFCWGAVLVSTSKNLIIKISHDEIIDIFARDKQSFSEIRGRLNGLLNA